MLLQVVCRGKGIIIGANLSSKASSFELVSPSPPTPLPSVGQGSKEFLVPLLPGLGEGVRG